MGLCAGVPAVRPASRSRHQQLDCSHSQAAGQLHGEAALCTLERQAAWGEAARGSSTKDLHTEPTHAQSGHLTPIHSV